MARTDKDIQSTTLLLLAFCWSADVSGLPDSLSVVGLFNDASSDLKYVFDYAISTVNEESDLRTANTRLHGKKHDIPPLDSYRASKQICQIFHEPLLAILGPQHPFSADNVQSIAASLGVPHIEGRWDYRIWSPNESFSTNLYPDHRALSRAFGDLIRLWRWTTFTILYETTESVIRLHEVLRTATKVKISMRLLKGPNYHDVLKDVRTSGESRIILDCHVRKIPEILRQAKELKLVSPYHQFLLTTLDIHTLDLSMFTDYHLNITGLRLFDPETQNVQTAVRGWTSQRITPGSVGTVPGNVVATTEQALLYDSVLLVAKALTRPEVADLSTMTVSCDKDIAWSRGKDVVNTLGSVQINGLTGLIKFDENRTRSEFELGIIQLLSNGYQEVGKWNPRDGAALTWDYSDHLAQIRAAMRNKTLRAIAVDEKPYIMTRTHENGTIYYEGYGVDLLEKIAKVVGFKYTLEVIKDEVHGVFDEKSGEWNGLVRQLMDKQADMAVGAITISYNREKAVDFTKPFMHLGIAILYKRPKKTSPLLFSFLHPLTYDVWLYTVTSFVVVSLTIFILARFSPYEWYNPHPCNEEGDVIENQFTICNSLWFTIGSLMQQGSDIAPRAVSTRLVAGCWWFFTLIMISSYTANLAAFLTVERMKLPIENADDLSKQNVIKYGCYKGGATYNFFKESKLPVYKRMWDAMNSDQSNFAKSTRFGVERVRSEKEEYAFLMESPSLEFEVSQDCDLTQIGNLLDSKGFGIATPKSSPYRDEISKAILKLQEESELHKSKDRWWKKNMTCDGTSKPQDQASELGLANVGGVFVILGAGLVLAFAVAILEFVWKVRRTSSRYQDSIPTEMSHALCFAIRLHGSSKKPVVRLAHDTLENRDGNHSA